MSTVHRFLITPACLVLFLTSCFTIPADHYIPKSTPIPTAGIDPTLVEWGVLGQMVGSVWELEHPTAKYGFSFQWEVPGRRMRVRNVLRTDSAHEIYERAPEGGKITYTRFDGRGNLADTRTYWLQSDGSLVAEYEGRFRKKSVTMRSLWQFLSRDQTAARFAVSNKGIWFITENKPFTRQIGPLRTAHLTAPEQVSTFRFSPDREEFDPEYAELERERAEQARRWQQDTEQLKADLQASNDRLANVVAETQRQAAAERNAQAAAERNARAAAEQNARATAERNAQVAAEQAARVAAQRNTRAAAERPAREAMGTASGAGRASTDTDANRCVTRPETKQNDTFEGSTSASVVNGCGQPVDVLICLMRDTQNGSSGWNCGVDNNVASQARASHSSFRATGTVHVDARTTGSGKAFTYPPGYR